MRSIVYVLFINIKVCLAVAAHSPHGLVHGFVVNMRHKVPFVAYLPEHEQILTQIFSKSIGKTPNI
jgi:hypothetical protein